MVKLCCEINYLYNYGEVEQLQKNGNTFLFILKLINFFLKNLEMLLSKSELIRIMQIFLGLNILLIIPFLRRMFFSNWGKKGQVNIKKRYYSDFYKTSNKYQKEILNKIDKMFKDGDISENKYKLLRNYIENNFKHVKFGEYEILENGNVVFEAYDITSKNKGRVYINFDKEKDKYVYLFINEKGVKSYVNETTIKNTFSSVDEFNSKIKKMGSKEVKNILNIKEKDQKLIGEKLQTIQNINTSEEVKKSFILSDLEVKKGKSLHFKEMDKNKDDFID